MGLTAGARLGHYEIVSPLGAGGMGEVYRATDTKLGRAVALKMIAPDMASERERLDRFRREAKALATIDHPNIVTVFSIEEDAGVHFLTMQLVESQSLDRVIGDGGEEIGSEIRPRGLPIGRIVQIASAIAEALVAAHDKGIVDRDLKPTNVMCERRRSGEGTRRCCGASGTASAALLKNMRRRAPAWNERSKTRRVMPMDGLCCRSSTRKSTRLDSMPNPILSGGLSGRRSERPTPHLRMRLRITRWPELASSARNFKPSGPLRSALSRSTQWTAALSPSWVF